MTWNKKLGQIWSQNCNVPDFYEIWQSEQIEHANYGYINWPWPEIRYLRNLVPKLKCAPIFNEIWHLEQVEHADCECSTWNWWYWPKIIDSGKFGPNTEICSNFYEIWHSQQIEHAYYEYNTSQCLERWHDYRLRMIAGSEHETIIRTIIVPIIVPFSERLYVVKSKT